jgi:sugar fermentation stimulation protein A
MNPVMIEKGLSGGRADAGESKAARLTWPDLIEGTLVRRYKRFLADVKLRDGQVVTAHCPNSGSMKACAEAGRPVFLSSHDTAKRRLRYTWELIDMGSSLVGVNTLVPNRLVRTAVIAGAVAALTGYETVRSEVNYGAGSRVDLLLERNGDKCFVEVKNCTLVVEGEASFPDAVTSRGLKHLVELQEQVRKGHRAVMFFLVQRMDARRFRPADAIDPAYGKELRRALQNGVEAFVYDVSIDLTGIGLNRRLPLIL